MCGCCVPCIAAPVEICERPISEGKLQAQSPCTASTLIPAASVTEDVGSPAFHEQPEQHRTDLWPTAEELEEARRLRERLLPEEAEQLNRCPEDIRHDLMLCRFLRGHGHEASKALPYLRRHLGYRRKHAGAIARVRARLPPDLVDSDLSIFQDQYGYVQDIMKILQLPADSGSNSGMQMSLLPLSLFKMKDVADLSDDVLAEWFIAIMEMRSVCLHNQSLREHRMAKVVEVRDCQGFCWTSFLTGWRKFKSILDVACNYPEFLQSFQLFNLQPNLRSISIMRHFLPREILAKMIFAERGDWDAIVRDPRGLSAKALHCWSQHLDHFRGSSSWLLLGPDQPQLIRTTRIRPGLDVSWSLRVSAAVAGSPPVVAVRLRLFSDAQAGQVPTIVDLRREEMVRLGGRHAGSGWCEGVHRATQDGTVALELELQGSAKALVLATVAVGEKGSSSATRASASLQVLPKLAQETVEERSKDDLGTLMLDMFYVLLGALTAVIVLLAGGQFLEQAGL